jgi:hypothetical protein
VNVFDTLPKKLQAEARAWLTKIPYAATRAEAERLKRAFQAWATKKGVAGAGRRLEEDWERLVTFYAFPKEHWKHLRTTNVVESPFAAVRLRTALARRFKKVENATAVIWKTLLVAERTFRRLDAPERLPEVAEGVVYVDGVREKRGLGLEGGRLISFTHFLTTPRLASRLEEGNIGSIGSGHPPRGPHPCDRMTPTQTRRCCLAAHERPPRGPTIC